MLQELMFLMYLHKNIRILCQSEKIYSINRNGGSSMSNNNDEDEKENFCNDFSKNDEEE